MLLLINLSTHPFIHILGILSYYTLPLYFLGSWEILKSKLEPSRIPIKNKYHKQFLFPNTFIRFLKRCQLQRTWRFCWCSLSFRFRQRNQTIKQNSSLPASSPIWASEASLARARARERQSREQGRGRETLAPRSRVLARFTSLAQTGELARRLAKQLQLLQNFFISLQLVMVGYQESVGRLSASDEDVHL